MKNIENLEKKTARLKEQNNRLKEDLAALKKEKIFFETASRDRGFIFHAIPVGIMVIQQGKIMDVNETLLEMLDYKAEEITGRHFLSLIHATQKKSVREIHKKWDEGKMPFSQYEASLITREGSSLYCNVNAKRIRIKGRRNYILAFTLLEKRREIEYQNIKTGRNNAQVNMARGFGNRLHGFAESVLKGINKCREEGSPLNKGSDDILKGIEKEVHDVLSDARILDIIACMEEEYAKQVIFDLNRVINEAVAFMKMGLKEKFREKDLKISTYLRSTSRIKGNPDELKEAMSQLIANSIEAMPEGGEIYITAEEDNKFSYIYIQDSGLGMPEEIQDKVFEPFFSTRGMTGRGLGLSLSNAIIRRHGGDMEVSSREGQGAIFQIRLPFVKDQEIKTGKPVKEIFKNKRVLIIQDKDIVRGLLAHLLKDKGCMLNSVDNWFEGLAILKKKKFDMIIADIAALGIPEANFIKRCGRINSDMPVVMIREAEEGHNPGSVNRTDTGLDIARPIDINRLVDQSLRLLIEHS